MLNKSSFGTARPAFLMAEALTALGLLGILIAFIAVYEYRAGAAMRSLEQQYVAAAAAESQFERLTAGLEVLAPEAFRRRYPGLDLDYEVQSATGTNSLTRVVTVKTIGPNPHVLLRLTKPVSLATTGSGGIPK